MSICWRWKLWRRWCLKVLEYLLLEEVSVLKR